MIKASNYVIKLRAYPTAEQRQKIDAILNGVRVAYNVTAYEITQGNPLVTKPDKKDEAVLWPNFGGCMKKEWLSYLRDNYEAVKCVPSTALSSSAYGIFGVDMKKSWENNHPLVPCQDKAGNQKVNKAGKPVFERLQKAVKLPATKWKPDYYSKKKPRTSFTVQTCVSGFVFSDESKTVRVGVTNVGKVKCRGWRTDIRFGEDGSETFTEAFEKKKTFGVIVSKDNCGDYYLAVKLQTVWIPNDSAEKIPIGVDVGIKDVAITSDGEKYQNQHYKKKEKRHRKRLNRKMSRRQGWANEEFREEHQKNDELKPSGGYEKAKAKMAKLDRKIARRREWYNNNVSASIVNKSSFVGIESLNVKGMMSNHHLAFALSDAAMHDILFKIKYKADWQNVPVVEIGQWEPSSQLCNVCGYKNPKVKNLNVREWTCPECGSHHDRDINAAKNILSMAEAKKSDVS